MKRLKAKVGISYPVGRSVKIIADAGGIRRLPPEQRAKLQFRQVRAGEFCDDIPEIGPNGSNPRKAHLAAGNIEEVTTKAKKK